MSGLSRGTQTESHGGATYVRCKITVEERHGRQCASTGAKWEPIMGYSRAVRSGNVIAVTGTVASTPTAPTANRSASKPPVR